MSSDDRPPRSGSFSDYQGEIEIDLPEGKRPGDLEQRPRMKRPSASTWDPMALREEADRRSPDSPSSPLRGRQKPDPPAGGGFPLRAIIIVLFLGTGVFGGYFGWCRWQIMSIQKGFEEQGHDLRQALLRRNTTVTSKDIESIVMEMAHKANVEVDKTQLKIIIEPLDMANRKRLTTIAQTALNMASKVSNHRGPRWFVGFNGRFRATHGIAKKIFIFERYTWSDWAQPDSGATPAAP